MKLIATMLAGTALALPIHAAAEERAAPSQPGAESDPVTPDSEDIIIIGRGETRQVQQLSERDFALLTPGTSPLKAIEKLPGVNFQAADPFGAYEWSQRVSIRGFNQNQIGFTLDGIPLGDGSYGNTNGLHVSRAISSENIGQTQVSQGAGSLGTQATNNLGGTIEFFSRDPSDTPLATLNGTYGSENTVRGFFRFDTGTLGDNGPRAYFSYGYLDMDKWKGVGSQRQHQANFKAVAPVTPSVELFGTFNFSDRRENDYQDLSLGMIDRLGYDWDNISGDYPLAIRIADIAANRGDSGALATNPGAGTAYPSPIASVDDAYFNAAGLRTDYLASVGVRSAAGSPVRFTLTGYYHNNRGQGIWYTPYVVSATSNVPISIRTTEYDIKRKGVFGSVTGDLAFNELTVGGWFERNDFRQARRFYALASRLYPTRDSLDFQALPFATQWDFDYRTDTFQYFVRDKITLGALTVNLGWKGFEVTNEANPIVGGGLASGEIRVRDWFQPHAGVAFALTDDAELFGGFTQVKRAFTASATTGPFATTQVGFDNLGGLRPEESDTYEIGGRLRGRGFNLSLAGYYVDFRDRLIAQSVGAGIQGNPAILQNVGSVRSLGFEAAAEVRLPMGFGAFASYSYTDSTYRDDVFDRAGAVVAATEDRQVVDTPKHLVKGEVTYDGEMFFGRLGANYMSRRYFTYENDQFVDGRVLVDATIGVRIRLEGERGFELQGNATNLFDEAYVATIGSNGFGNRGDNQTLLAGAPQQFFVTVKTGF
jgi:iron complex outermembrane recepter protein